MAKTFACPHCDNTYPILPTLVGRKVRCTHCKNAFQLQYDGIAIKVGAGSQAGTNAGPQVQAREPSGKQEALESKSPDLKSEKKPKSATGVDTGVRPQTKAIKRHTERNKKTRSSLQDAAQQAVQSVETSGAVSKDDDKIKASTQPKSATTVEREKGISSVVLTGSEQQQRQINKQVVLVLVLICAAFYGISFLLSETLAERCLREFTEPVSSVDRVYPNRLPAYQKRMWAFTRDGKEPAPVLLNVDKAHVAEEQRFDWTEVVAACSPELDNLEMNLHLGIWHLPQEREKIESHWDAYVNKRLVEGFYQGLTRHKIRHLRFEELQPMLLKKGISKEAVYVISILLAGTSDASGARIADFGLKGDVMPSQLIMHEFNGEEGHILIDSGGVYAGSTTPVYSGLIAGFVNYTGLQQTEDQWRILDVRLGAEIDAYYAAAHNPLAKLAERIHEDLRAEMPLPGSEAEGP